MKKYLAITALLSCVILATFFNIYFFKNNLSMSIALNRDQFSKLKLDMSLDEAIHILGLPPGDYTSGRVVNINPSLKNLHRDSFQFSKLYIWSDDITFLSIAVDEDGRVCRIFAICNQRVY